MLAVSSFLEFMTYTANGSWPSSGPGMNSVLWVFNLIRKCLVTAQTCHVTVAPRAFLAVLVMTVFTAEGPPITSPHLSVVHGTSWFWES